MGDELDAGGTGGSGSLLHKYRILGKAGEGTFSEVLKAVHIHTKKYVAIKRMKQKFQSVQQVNNLREVQALRRLNPHHHIIGLREIIFDRRIGSLSPGLGKNFFLKKIVLFFFGKKHFLTFSIKRKK